MFDSDHNNSGMPKNISLYYPVPGMCLYVGSPKILDLKNKKKKLEEIKNWVTSLFSI